MDKTGRREESPGWGLETERGEFVLETRNTDRLHHHDGLMG